MTGWFYRTQLRFAVAAEEELGAQLERLGIAPTSVDTAVLSHLHSDHIGGLGALGEATWLISARDAGGHAGALTCRMPAHEDTRLVTPGPDPFGAFANSHRVSADGNVRIVATPGHTAGHQSLLLRDGERWVLLAGDVVFDHERLTGERAMAGIVEDPAAARRSIALVEEQMARFDTLLATAHDGAIGRHGGGENDGGNGRADGHGHGHGTDPER